MNDYSRILGIDYGSVRIGLSLSDPLKIIASGITTIENNERSIDKILQILFESNVQKIVVGFPLTLKGEIGSKAEEVEQFISLLRSKTEIEIVAYDERFTSVIALQTIRELGTSKKKRRSSKGKVDEIAAVILLQNYLDSVNR